MKPISLYIEIQPDTSLDAPTGGGTPLFLLVPDQADLSPAQHAPFVPGSVAIDLRDGQILLRLDQDDTGAAMQERQWYSCRGAKVRIATSPSLDHNAARAREETFHSRDASPAELHITAKDGRAARPYPLELREGEFVLLGRDSPDAQLNIRDEHVSRRHLRILTREGRHYLEDLGSTWGTKLNSAPVPAHDTRLLHHRDEILVGNSTITYVNVLEALREPPSQATPPAPSPHRQAISKAAATQGGKTPLLILATITLAMTAYLAWRLMS